MSIQSIPHQFNQSQTPQVKSNDLLALQAVETLIDGQGVSESLGNNASIVVPEQPRGFQKSQKLVNARSNVDTEEYRKIEKIRYKMLSTTRKALKKHASKNHRIAACHYEFAPNGGSPEIVDNPEIGVASWRNLKKCDNEFCPVCSVHVGVQTRNRIARIMSEAYAQDMQAVLCTLTMQHDARHNCDDNVNAMMTAWRKMTQDAGYRELCEKYGVFGYLKGTDQTFSPVNGLHFHFHIVYLIHSNKFDENDWHIDYDDESLWSQFAAIWSRMVAAVGRTCIDEIAVNFQVGDQYIAEYIAKHGYAPKESRWDITAEISLKTVKRAPDEHYTLFELMLLAHAGDAWATSMYVDFCDAMHRKNRLNLSQSVRDLEKHIVDVPAAEDDLPNITREKLPSFRVTQDAFRVARNTRNKRGQWLLWYERRQFMQLAHDVAHCHVLGKFQYQASTLAYVLLDGWHSVIEVSLQGQADFVESTEVGRVLVRDGVAIEVVVTQPLDSGFYGKFVTEGG